MSFNGMVASVYPQIESQNVGDKKQEKAAVKQLQKQFLHSLCVNDSSKSH